MGCRRHLKCHIQKAKFKSVYAARENGEEFLVKEVDGKILKEHFDYLLTLPVIGDIVRNLRETGYVFPETMVYHFAFFNNGYLSFHTHEPYPESHDIFKRFAKVFEQTYTRFLDLKKAEAQAKEAQIEAALERVRSEAMAMHSSDGLLSVTLVLREQMAVLEQKELESILIHIYDELNDTFEAWFSYRYPEDPEGKIKNGKVILDWSKTTRALKDKQKYYSSETDYTIVADYAMLKEWYEYLDIKVSEVVEHDAQGNILVPDVLYYNYSKFSGGTLLLITNNEASADSKYLLKRSAEVFNLAYRRFLDLQKAEAQSREAQVETALERVRSRTLAMQKSGELTETAAVLFRQLIGLGIEPHRLYISIMKGDEGEAEFWITDEDGSKVSSAYTDNLNDNGSFKKMYDGWKSGKQSIIVDLQGKELNDYFQHLNRLGVSFKDGLQQKRRIQLLAYFNRGFIGMAAPDDQPKETIHLLERFAAVFNLTFTRFNDLKIAEAHAVQAEQDLIEIKVARKNAEEALSELQVTQNQLIQKEKMASLGELTAGIAHEIQNPINFVNNFSEVSKELLVEMKAALEKGNHNEAEEIANDIIQNLEKINHHGRRADAIVKGMLQHSRQTQGKKEPTDINALCDEYLRLSYHGLRAKDKSFNADFRTNFDQSIGKIKIVPQDFGRVLLNLYNNAFYAVNERQKKAHQSYMPTVFIETKKVDNKIEINVKDNGSGIPQHVVPKIFQPFFTTKPTGQGTGLVLSLAYDIITKEHDGTVKVNSKEGEGSEFIIQLPET